METSDIDEFRYDRGEYVHDSDGTLTHSIETSDPDEFKLDITGETRSIETSDLIQIISLFLTTPTMITRKQHLV